MSAKEFIHPNPKSALWSLRAVAKNLGARPCTSFLLGSILSRSLCLGCITAVLQQGLYLGLDLHCLDMVPDPDTSAWCLGMSLDLHSGHAGCSLSCVWPWIPFMPQVLIWTYYSTSWFLMVRLLLLPVLLLLSTLGLPSPGMLPALSAPLYLPVSFQEDLVQEFLRTLHRWFTHKTLLNRTANYPCMWVHLCKPSQ